MLLIGKSVYGRKIIYITGLQNRICKSGMINAVGHLLSFEAAPSPSASADVFFPVPPSEALPLFIPRRRDRDT